MLYVGISYTRSTSMVAGYRSQIFFVCFFGLIFRVFWLFFFKYLLLIYVTLNFWLVLMNPKLLVISPGPCSPRKRWLALVAAASSVLALSWCPAVRFHVPWFSAFLTLVGVAFGNPPPGGLCVGLA